MSEQTLSDAEIFSAASEPVRDDRGRFAPQPDPQAEPRAQDAAAAVPERQAANLGQLPDEGRPDEGRPDLQAPQPDPRQAGMMRDLQEERRRRQEREAEVAARDRQIAEMTGAIRAMQAHLQGQGRQPQPQPPQAPPRSPDPFEDPHGFAQHHSTRMTIRSSRLERDSIASRSPPRWRRRHRHPSR